MRCRVAQIGKDRPQSRRSSHGVNERDGGVSVAGIGKKDARKGGCQVGKERVRVAAGIDRVQRTLERREGIESRESRRSTNLDSRDESRLESSAPARSPVTASHEQS